MRSLIDTASQGLRCRKPWNCGEFTVEKRNLIVGKRKWVFGVKLENIDYY